MKLLVAILLAVSAVWAAAINSNPDLNLNRRYDAHEIYLQFIVAALNP